MQLQPAMLELGHLNSRSNMHHRKQALGLPALAMFAAGGISASRLASMRSPR